MTNQSNKVSEKDIKNTKTKGGKTSEAAVVSTKKEKKEKKPVVDSSADDVDASAEEEVDGEGKKKRVAPTKDSVIKYFDDLIKSIEDEVENLRESENKTKGVKFLRTLNKRLKILKNQSSRIIKQKRTTTRTNTNNNSGFLVYPGAELKSLNFYVIILRKTSSRIQPIVARFWQMKS